MTQSMTFSQALDWIKLHLDIVEVVGRHVPLKRAGRNMMGLCPFHSEKSPSFTVSAEKQLFKCFGCGEGGDSLSFLMKLDNKSFSDVILELADQHGIDILRDGHAPNPAQKAERETLLELHQKAAELYRDHLVNTPMPQDYLAQRGLSPMLQAQFGLGYAPPGWRHLQEALQQKHPGLEVTTQALTKIGLLIQKDSQKEDALQSTSSHYDRFRNRLMVPIADDKGNVVAFGARALDPADEPKYLNSPETELYVKHRVLFGLHLAKPAIRASESAVVMEGYFDVISAHAVGWTQAVGACGTALSPEHLKLLQRAGAKTIYLCFDTDKAGQNATLKTLEALHVKASDSGLTLKVVSLPIGKDPDEYFRSDRPEHIRETLPYLLDDAVNGWAYQFDAALANVTDLHTMDGRIQAASRITPILSRIHKPVLQHEWVRLLAKRIGVPEESLHLELKQLANVTQSSSGAPYPQAKYAQNQKTFPNGAISTLDPRYKKRSASNGYQNGRGAAGSSRQKQLMALGVQEDVRELRKHLAPKKNPGHKEAELLSFVFLSESMWDYVMSACESFEFSTPENQWFMGLLQGLTRELRDAREDAPIDTRILRLREAIHTDSSTGSEQKPTMLKFLADRVFEADRLAAIYKTPSVSAKPVAIIDTIIASLKLSQEKQRLGDMLNTLRSAEIAGDEMSAQLGRELSQLLTTMRVSLGQQSLDASTTSGGHPSSPQTVDTATPRF